jgi:hypothetical protein
MNAEGFILSSDFCLLNSFILICFLPFLSFFVVKTDPENILISSTDRVMFLRPNITYIRRGKAGREKYDSSFTNNGPRNLTETDLG